MNNRFSIRRLAHLFVKFSTENARRRAFSRSLLMILLALGAYISHKVGFRESANLFYIGSFVLMLLWILYMTLDTLREVQHTFTSTRFLILPATRAEKFAYLWLRSLPVAFVQFVAYTAIVCGISNLIISDPESHFHLLDFAAFVLEMNFLPLVTLQTILLASCINASSNTPSRKWRRMIGVLVFIFLLNKISDITICDMTLSSLLPPTTQNLQFFGENGSLAVDITAGLSFHAADTLYMIFLGITTAVFLAIAWFRFKEREIK